MSDDNIYNEIETSTNEIVSEETSSKKGIHIEKYDIKSYKKEGLPFTMIPNDVIQNWPSDRPDEFHLWIYLQSQHPKWEPCKYQIMNHFKISERTYERRMSWLKYAILIDCQQIRNEAGFFAGSELIVLNGSRFNPNGKKPKLTLIENNPSAKSDNTPISDLKQYNLDNIHRSAKSDGADDSAPIPINLHKNQRSAKSDGPDKTDTISTELELIPQKPTVRQTTVLPSNGGP